jgi:aspartate aminotransferase
VNSTKLSKRVDLIKPSPTIAVSTRAQEMRAAGHDVIGLGAGEPDFDTPDHIKAAAIDAIETGAAAKYTAVDGIAPLKTAIQNKFSRENDLHYQADQILVSVGAKHSLFNLFLALLNDGDEVIVPAPYWVSYPDMVTLVGGSPVVINAGADQKFKISPDQLEAAITERTRLLIMNSPSNPTGFAYSEQELGVLAEVLLKHPQVWVVSDDIYEHVLWTPSPFVNMANVCPDLSDRMVIINGVSKAYAMTGWRIGYAAGPAVVIQAMKKIQSQSTSNPCAVSQYATVAALSGDQHCVQDMVVQFKLRHDHVVTRLNKLTGVSALEGDGTFYSFPNCADVISARDDISNDIELASMLLTQAGVALVPGSAFGLEGHLRLSFATDMDTLNEALDRLEKALGTK